MARQEDVEQEPQDELYLHIPDTLCGDPCPEAPDLWPCLLLKGHGGEWHRNRSSSWPVSAGAEQEEEE